MSGAVSLGAVDRFDRLRRIGWWKQERLTGARVLVLGVGALGNEIVKNLALLGVGWILIGDMDEIEITNLSRSVLFRERDCGRPKALAAAEAARDIFPGIRAHAFVGDLIYGLGLGAFRWADVVIAGMDNREARLAINRACWRVGRPWVDGATETLGGVVRVFAPQSGACYECTLSAAEWEIIKERRGCGLRPDGLPAVPVPTTPVTASVVAALQCQEAVKLLYGMESLAGGGWVFDGLSNATYTVRYNADPECGSHDPLTDLVELDRSASGTTLGELAALVGGVLGGGATIELNQELLTGFWCPRCKLGSPVFRPIGEVAISAAACPACGVERRPDSVRTLTGEEPFAGRALADLGVPPFDIVAARKGERLVGFLFAADAATVLGPLGASCPVEEPNA